MFGVALVLATSGTWAASAPVSSHSPSPLSPSAPREPRVLTLREALELATGQNPTLKAVQAQEQGAWWAYRTGVSLPPATLTLTYMDGNNTMPTMSGVVPDYSVMVNQSFGPVRSTALMGLSARQGYEAARAMTRQAHLALVQGVKDAFYGLLVAQEQMGVARENQDLAQHILDLARKRFESGAGPRMDLLNAQVQQATSEQAAIQATNALKQAQTSLAPWLGLGAGEPLVATGTTTLPSLPLVHAVLEQVALQSNPRVEIATRALEQSQTQVRLARSQSNPTPSLFYIYDLRLTPLYTVGAAISFPLDWGQIRNNVRQQQAVVEEKRKALDGARLAVSSSVKSALDSYQAALANVETYREKVLKPTEELMAMTQFGLRPGSPALPAGPQCPADLAHGPQPALLPAPGRPPGPGRAGGRGRTSPRGTEALRAPPHLYPQVLAAIALGVVVEWPLSSWPPGRRNWIAIVPARS